MPIERQDLYRIELRPNQLQLWSREVITLRKASKDMDCNECGSSSIEIFDKHRISREGVEMLKMTGRTPAIKKGELYIRDKFWYNGYVHVVKVVNFVCMKCWTGPIPKLVSNNWIKDR